MAVATKVKQHLHERQLSMHTVGKTKKKGLIELRAESIERNILKLRTKPESEEQTHKTEVISAYQKKGDPVEEIFHELKKNATQNQSIHPKVALRISAEILHKHYAKIFGHEMQISQAKENHPELFCLHQRVKDTYRQKLKRSKMKGMTDKRIDQIIPKNLERLLNLSKKITANRNLNDEIRLGKVIHYHLLRDLKDQQKPSEALEDQHWNDHKDKIEQSEFWSSEKQIEIKQAEAFIRVWRGAIAFIARNLRHLSTFDDDGVSNAHKDILLEREIKNAICTFDNKKFDGKMRTLFGSEISKELLDDEDHNKALFRFMLKTVSGLRNGVFHFKDISYLKNGLEQKGAWTPDEKQENSHQESLKDRFHKIWCDHQNQRKQRIIDELEAVKISNFIASDGITKIVDLLQRDEGGSLPLPKFKRVVEHAKNLGAGFRFSEIINRHNMEENEALRCQYVITKQLYERPFRHYLDGMSKEELTEVDGLNNIFNVLNIDFKKPITICEGQFDSMFIDNCIASTGVGKTKDTVEMIKGDSKKRILLDNDKAGRQGSIELLKRGYDTFLWSKLIGDLKKSFPSKVSEIKQVTDINALYQFMKSNDPAYKLSEFNKTLDGYFSNSMFDIIYL